MVILQLLPAIFYQPIFRGMRMLSLFQQSLCVCRQAATGSLLHRNLSYWLVAACLLQAVRSRADEPVAKGLTRSIQVSVVDDAVLTYYATFFNVNQRMVVTDDGIFLVYLKDTHDDPQQPPSRNHWLLCRSTDGGDSFEKVFEVAEEGDTNIVGKAPEILADSAGNLFLITCMNDYHVHVWRFDRGRWSEPVYHQRNRYGGYAPKFSVRLDPVGDRLLVMTAAYFMSIDPETGIADHDGTYQMLQDGRFGYPQYSFLSLVPDGRLFAAWHTTRIGARDYYDIHYAVSSRHDRFSVWRSPLDDQLLGDSVNPIVCDHSGPAPMLNRQEELSPDGTQTNAVNHFIYKGNALHVLHGGKRATDAYVQAHYTRVSMVEPHAIHQIVEPELGGEVLRLDASDGFFCTTDTEADSPLFLVSHRQGRVIVLVSFDNGDSWSDYAESDYRASPASIYSITGQFKPSQHGIIGVFTEVRPELPHRLMLFRIPTP